MDANKRRIYDQYGSLGLKLAEQIGEEVSFTINNFVPWAEDWTFYNKYHLALSSGPFPSFQHAVLEWAWEQGCSHVLCLSVCVQL